MIHLITGVPGAKKTAYTVTQLDKIETNNKVNLVKNIKLIDANLKIIAANDLQSDFTYYDYQVGSGHTIRDQIDILDDDYFDMLGQEYDDLRPDDYYKRAEIYNHCITRIIDREGVKGLSHLLPVRTIYSNINGLKIDYTRSLTYDWRDCPDGSIVVIDEVQLVEPYKETKKDDAIVSDLTIHRHRGFDFYFITQSAGLLHKQIKDLIGVHYHLTLPWGWITKVYQYGSFRANPNAVSVKMASERTFSFNPPDRIFKLYKSTTINTHQKRIPYKPLLGFAALVIGAFTMFVWALGGSKDSKLINGMIGNPVATVAPSPVSMPVKQQSVLPASMPLAQPQPQPQPQQFTMPDSAPNKGIFDPLTGDYISDINKAPVNVMRFAGRCEVYNYNGQPLLHIDADTCNTYADNPRLLVRIKQPDAPALTTDS